LAAPLALHVPLSVLAGILLFVAWNMGEWREFAKLSQYSTHYRVLMVGTFVLTVVFDLTVALEVGVIAACVLFIVRMNTLFTVESVPTSDGTMRFRLYGSMFFGAAVKLDAAVQAVEAGPDAPLVLIDALHLVHLDATGLDALRQLHKAVLLRGGTLVLESLQDAPREVLERAGFLEELAAHQVSREVTA
jgi:sulfate permease, SulP family